jgi:hypothetical protein
MKKLVALSMAFCVLNANAKLGSSNDKVKYAGDLAYSNFCEAIVKDDVNLLKRSVRSKVGQVANSPQRVLKRLIAEDGVACNGIDLVSFSHKRSATEVSKYLSNAK